MTGVEPGMVIGHEYAGIVEEVGQGVRDLHPGDRVAGSLSHVLRPLLVLPSRVVLPVRAGGVVWVRTAVR